MTKYIQSARINVCNVRILFSRLCTPSEKYDTYESTFILNKENKAHKEAFELLQSEAEKVSDKHWEMPIDKLGAEEKNIFLKDGDNQKPQLGKEPREYLNGHWYFKAKARITKPPQVVDWDLNKISAENELDNLYDGALCNAAIEIESYEKPTIGIRANILAVQAVGIGERIVTYSPESVDDIFNKIEAPAVERASVFNKIEPTSKVDLG